MRKVIADHFKTHPHLRRWSNGKADLPLNPLRTFAMGNRKKLAIRILRALDIAKGHRGDAARLLNMPRSLLYQHIARLGLWRDIKILTLRRNFKGSGLLREEKTGRHLFSRRKQRMLPVGSARTVCAIPYKETTYDYYAPNVLPALDAKNLIKSFAVRFDCFDKALANERVDDAAPMLW